MLVSNSRRCRLLYVVGQLGPGGLERQLWFLLRCVDRVRFRPEVVVWNYHEPDRYVRPIRELEIPLHCFSNQQSKFQKLEAFRQLVQCLKPEVVHSYSFYTNFAAWWATLGTNSLAIGAVRSDFADDKRSSGFLLGRLSARSPHRQIYNSFAAAESARNSWSIFKPTTIFVVRNGIDLQEFRQTPVLTDGPTHILGVGSLLQYKRWDRLVRAASNLKQKDYNFIMEIAGGGPIRESLERDLRDLELTDRVRFLGHMDDVARLMEKSTFLAHTSDIEGCPNVIMEAMACGRAVVATDAGDVPSLIEHGKTGFIVRRGDDAELTARLSTLIADRKLCIQMGEAARKKAEREFGLDRLVNETLAAYRATGWIDA